MKWAVAQGYRGDNPAGDAISAALPKTTTTSSGTPRPSARPQWRFVAPELRGRPYRL